MVRKYLEDALLRAQQASYESLKAGIPELQDLESQPVFETFQLVRAIINPYAIFEFDVKAPSLFPYVRQRLIDSDIVKRHNIIHTGGLELEDEVYRVTIGFRGRVIQVTLNFTEN